MHTDKSRCNSLFFIHAAIFSAFQTYLNYPDTSRWDARLKAALHKRHPVLKRVLVAALTLVILTLGALAVSADFRKAVYTMIQKFLPIEMQLTYQVDGEPLEQLPNGYSDHYVPDGFERDREQEFERAENFLHV